jgi:exopolysaccharide biosynthesis polyprenyl glycosylphosphotransferase
VVANVSLTETASNIRCLLVDRDIEAVILAPDHRDRKVIYRLIHTLLPYGCPILLRAQEDEYIEGGTRTRSLTALPMLRFGADCIPPFRRNLKRAADIVVAALALIVLSPVFLALAVWIAMDSPGPVFYSQERVGRLGRPFRMYKFRSMRIDAESTGPQLSRTDDPRITKLGHVLRKYRLDELPQFWNVLRGDMSLVGPRPERPYYIDRIMATAPQYSVLLQLRPGITSWGMVKYGYAGDVFQMIERMRYDLMYLDNCTIPMDLKIIGYTIRTVLTGKGI